MREEDTFAYQLFHTQFEVSMPQAFAYLNPQHERRGIYTSGDKALDRELAFTMVTTYRTLSQLIELSNNGAKLCFNNVADVPRAYNVLQGFLDEWVSRLELNDIVAVVSPEEKERLSTAYKDIQQVEEFINLMIPAVQRTRPTQPRSKGLTTLHQLLGITEDQLLANRAQQAAQLTHTPLEDRLSRGALTRARRWR